MTEWSRTKWNRAPKSTERDIMRGSEMEQRSEKFNNFVRRCCRRCCLSTNATKVLNEKRIHAAALSCRGLVELRDYYYILFIRTRLRSLHGDGKRDGSYTNENSKNLTDKKYFTVLHASNCTLAPSHTHTRTGARSLRLAFR